eukprot:CAMPEP_0171735402 /NCGR_PEP_ID=MMETSP0991-20121206/31566_1 /TAXON_ID=483369 /ORGANISM="non described non described, Strain CCMP2098" /LENGTH=299 /DNA_ID=CAMNT_0012331721 /DNA_START=67 /DNA_END=966 /DNA_ORIENTATION=+
MNHISKFGKIATTTPEVPLFRIPPPFHRCVLEFLPLFDALVMTRVSVNLKKSLEAARWKDSIISLGLNEFNFDNAFVIAAASWFNRLISVDLRWCDKLTDMAVTTLAQNCPGLTSVNLDWCENLTDGALVALAEQCPGLTSVSLNGCENLTDIAVVVLAEHCSGLTSVSLNGYEGLSDFAVVALAEHCSGLTSVNLIYCEDLTDVAVVALAEHCCGLTSVDLSYCTSLTDGAVMALAEHRLGLASINFSGCKNLSAALRKYCCGLGVTSVDQIYLNEYYEFEEEEDLISDVLQLEFIGY